MAADEVSPRAYAPILSSGTVTRAYGALSNRFDNVNTNSARKHQQFLVFHHIEQANSRNLCSNTVVDVRILFLQNLEIRRAGRHE